MNKRRGFSLLEVIVAVMVISIAMVGVTGLVNRNLAQNLLNKNYLQAHYLNVEALEAIRNMRDSNWVQNYSFDANTSTLWGTSLWPGAGKVVAQVSKNEVGTPWRLQRTSTDFATNRLYFAPDDFLLTHDITDNPSNFARYIVLEPVTDPKLFVYENLQPLRVTAVTMFEANDKQRQVVYSTILTDWKQGPL